MNNAIQHFVVVICTRCGEREQFDPMPVLKSEYRTIGENRSVEDKTLHQVARIRPKGWGEVTMVRAPETGEQRHLLHHVLCPTCCEVVSVAANGRVEKQLSEDDRHG